MIFSAGLPRLRSDRRRAGAEELPVSRKYHLRPKRAEVQLVVLRGLRHLQEAVRLQHSGVQELPADEGARLFLFLQEQQQQRRQS